VEFPRVLSLGRFVCALYTADLVRLIENFGLHPHLYADDTQVYGFVVPSCLLLLTRVCWCISLHVRLDCIVSYVVS